MSCATKWMQIKNFGKLEARLINRREKIWGQRKYVGEGSLAETQKRGELLKCEPRGSQKLVVSEKGGVSDLKQNSTDSPLTRDSDRKALLDLKFEGGG